MHQNSNNNSNILARFEALAQRLKWSFVPAVDGKRDVVRHEFGAILVPGDRGKKVALQVDPTALSSAFETASFRAQMGTDATKIRLELISNLSRMVGNNTLSAIPKVAVKVDGAEVSGIQAVDFLEWLSAKPVPGITRRQSNLAAPLMAEVPAEQCIKSALAGTLKIDTIAVLQAQVDESLATIAKLRLKAEEEFQSSFAAASAKRVVVNGYFARPKDITSVQADLALD